MTKTRPGTRSDLDGRCTQLDPYFANITLSQMISKRLKCSLCEWTTRWLANSCAPLGLRLVGDAQQDGVSSK